MNWLNKLNAQSIRILFGSLALYAFILSGLGFYRYVVRDAKSSDQCAWIPREKKVPGAVIRNIVLGGVAEEAGLRDGDILLAINGQRFNSVEEAQLLLDRVPRAEKARY